MRDFKRYQKDNFKNLFFALHDRPLSEEKKNLAISNPLIY